MFPYVGGVITTAVIQSGVLFCFCFERRVICLIRFAHYASDSVLVTYNWIEHMLS